MSVVSPKTIEARAEVERILTRLTMNSITMNEAEHALWKLLNDAKEQYDEGYNHGWRACEDEQGLARQRKDEPPYKEL